jgi:hypothetical protein
MQAGGYGSQSRVVGSASAISTIVVVLAGSRRTVTGSEGRTHRRPPHPELIQDNDGRLVLAYFGFRRDVRSVRIKSIAVHPIHPAVKMAKSAGATTPKTLEL